MLRTAGTVGVVGLAILIVAWPGMPVQPAFATSNSMAPAIATNDVYFVVKGGDVDRGDVVMFYSTREGEYVTHRVVDRTQEGYITKGDNNPSTDQAAGHPPIDETVIVGTVVELGGRPVTISGVSPLVSFFRTNRLGLVGLAALILLGPELGSLLGRPERSGREVVFAGDIVSPLFVGLLVLAFILILWGASTHELLWVALGDPTTAPHTLPVGESSVDRVSVETYTPPFTTVITEAHGMTVLDRTVHGSTIDLTVRVPAIAEAGPYWSEVRVYPYPATLPEGILRWLHGIHWFAAAIGSILPAFGSVTVVYALIVDGKTRLRGPRRRSLRRLLRD